MSKIQLKFKFLTFSKILTHFHSFHFMGTRTADDFYSGTKAALAGGTTTIIDFVAPVPSGAGGYTKNLIECVEFYNKIAAEQACCDYAFHVVIAEYKKDKTEQEMAQVVQKFGINSFKVFMAYKGALMLKDDEIINVFDACKRLGCLPMVHAENGDIIAYQENKLIQYGITGPEGNVETLKMIFKTSLSNCSIVEEFVTSNR